MTEQRQNQLKDMVAYRLPVDRSSWPALKIAGPSLRKHQMLHDPSRHEALLAIEWNESQARETIHRIVSAAERDFSPQTYWPVHPRDLDGHPGPHQIAPSLYFGACGVMWALHYLQEVGAATLTRSHAGDLEILLTKTREWLHSLGNPGLASYMLGETPVHLMAYGRKPSEAIADRLATLIEGNSDNSTRELMWGAPGTLLAASFLHERTGDPRWAALFRETAARLWSQLQWSDEHACHYWTQDLYGHRSSYLDGVHGFVATASPLIRGRHLMSPEEWQTWEHCIVNTVSRTATWVDGKVNWRAQLNSPRDPSRPLLMQFCHGAPGFLICLAGLPTRQIDTLLLAAGEAIWSAGPLAEGSNLCHGTGGNGYAFLVLYQRTADPVWLQRARAFAMHGIAQTEAQTLRHGHMRHSLWTGDPGFAIFLWDCMRGEARFPTLDVFYADPVQRSEEPA